MLKTSGVVGMPLQFTKITKTPNFNCLLKACNLANPPQKPQVTPKLSGVKMEGHVLPSDRSDSGYPSLSNVSLNAFRSGMLLF